MDSKMPPLPETFHERCLDYRGAPIHPGINWAEKAYQGLEDCVLAYGAECRRLALEEALSACRAQIERFAQVRNDRARYAANECLATIRALSTGGREG